MPEGFGTGIQTQFAYVTVRQIRENNIPASVIPDNQLRSLIVAMSLWINSLTDQWFLPVRLLHKVDGRHSAVAHLPNFVPILELKSFKIGRPDLFTLDLPTVAYQVRPRYVQMMTPRMRLPELTLFVMLDGVFGWLADDFRRVITKTTAPVVVNATSISLESVSNIAVNDVLLVGGDPEPGSFPVIVDGISGNVISCEPVRFPLPAGVPVVRYGIVPPMIQRAAMLMCRDRVQLVGDIDIDEPPFGLGTRLTSESVEGYSYGLASTPAQAGHGGGALTTGNPEVDDYLLQYSRPQMYIGAV